MNTQQFEGAVIDACNATKHKSIAPGLCGICSECQSDYGMEPQPFYTGVKDGSVFDEGGFSWSDCECCGSSLGGDRFAAHGFADDDSILHFSICVDCLLYLANGDLPGDMN